MYKKRGFDSQQTTPSRLSCIARGLVDQMAITATQATGTGMMSPETTPQLVKAVAFGHSQKTVT